MRAVKTDPTLDLSNIRDASMEINKCAQRLRNNLVFPEAKGKKQKRDRSDDTDLKASLVELDGLIKGFVNNPFMTKCLRDDDLGTKASRDLDEIIELSNSIKKHSETLSKTAQSREDFPGRSPTKKGGRRSALPTKKHCCRASLLEAIPQHKLNHPRVPCEYVRVQEVVARRIAWDDVRKRVKGRTISQ